MRQLVDNPWFALADLLLVTLSAAAWMVFPKFGIVFTLIALLPWVLRILAGDLPIRRTPLDLLLVVFLATAWVGYWAAYDKSAAWLKYWLIVSAVLLYYALLAQPKQNLAFLSFLSFCLALILSLYFCLTYDFADNGGRIVAWWTNNRPNLDLPGIQNDDVLGLILISSIFAFYWLWKISEKSRDSKTNVMRLFLILGMGMVGLVFTLTLSRGIGLIVLSAVGLWVLWGVSTLSESYVRVKALFPILVFIYLAVLVAFTYIGPANKFSGSSHNSYGDNSRIEILGRGAYFLLDYPITGAGLNSFPGLYSQYMIVIPYFYFNNSYNLFLDVAIEQGWIGGAAFLIICLATIWRVSLKIVNNPSNEIEMVNWLSLFALLVMVIHGLFYDHLYYGNSTALLLFPIGMAMTGALDQDRSRDGVIHLTKSSFRLTMLMLTLPVLALIFVVGVNINNLISLGYANLGALQMSQAELKNFPTNQWTTSEMVYNLKPAESTLHTALRYDPQNGTANYRLGLISLLRQDFRTAATYLETAHEMAPNHRGIIKNLGYCYVWLGDMAKAQPLLAQISEAPHEMKVYVWWWETQNRLDLSEKASRMASRLEPDPQ